MSHRFFATAARGTEGALVAELARAGIVAEARSGGASFEGDLAAGYRACFWSRIASRVLLEVGTFEAGDESALYEGVSGVPWLDHLSVDRTFAVSVTTRGSAIDNPRFATLKAKDAIVDRIRGQRGARPDVDRNDPDVRVHVHLEGTAGTAYVDLAGEALHRRGSGRRSTAAPLRETLAAALLSIAGWSERAARGEPFVDPMCGSGTLVREAAAIALQLAPGLFRTRFGFLRWPNHDESILRALRAEAEARRAAAPKPPPIVGTDASAEAVEAARDNLRRAGVAASARIGRRAIEDVEPPVDMPGLVVTNPPYGERLGEAGELGPLYEKIGDVLRRRFLGWHAWVLSGNRALDKRLGLRAAERVVVHNGPIECRFLSLPIDTRPVERDAPGWRKRGKDAVMLENRLRKNLRKRRRWAKRQGVTAYRLYDAEIPEYNLAVDWYDGAARIEELSRPRSVDEAVAEQHLRDALEVVPEVLGLEEQDVVLRVRRRRRRDEQPPRFDETGRFRAVREGDMTFRVNLHDYLDTGLFLDDRLLRRRVAELAAGQRFLNLFAYTCTATVSAAFAGARRTRSVDLSNTYLDWGRQNLRDNGIDDAGRHELVRADCLRFLEEPARERWDLIFLAPPTYSRSKGMARDFDVQRDHVRLIRQAASRLSDGGRLIFTTNLRTFSMAPIDGLAVTETTDRTTPEDFRHSRPHRSFEVQRR